jgi:hypothetical protein
MRWVGWTNWKEGQLGTSHCTVREARNNLNTDSDGASLPEPEWNVLD